MRRQGHCIWPPPIPFIPFIPFICLQKAFRLQRMPAGEYFWRWGGSFHETHSDEGAVLLAIYRKPNVFQNSTGYARTED